MDYHHHARLTIHSREQLAKGVLQGELSLNSAAAEFKLSRQSAAKWVRRFRLGGREALRDRSSRPHRSPRTTSPELLARVERLRRERWTGVRIAQATDLSRATVSRIITRLKLNKARMLEPPVPILRYEHPAPGDLLHLDIKKLARIHKPGHRLTGNPQDETRGAGWEFLYVAVDDHLRIAFTAMFPVSVRGCLPRLAATCGSKRCAHAFTLRAPTAKPNASFKQPSANGPMRVSTRTPPTDSRSWPPGFTATIGIDRMLASISRRPFLGPASMLTTS